MGRIEKAFSRLAGRDEKGLIPFLVAGDPDIATTKELILAAARAGADVVELGVPFSDPMADGPTIQAASERALERGISLKKILALVSDVRTQCDVPIVLMGYFNPIFVYGSETFAKDAAAAGVDGVLVVDLPPEEAGELKPYLSANGIDFITLVAPTSPKERRAQLLDGAGGFVYYVSMTGVTGVNKVDPTAIARRVDEIRQESPIPVGVGFGISTPEDAEAVGNFADAVVVGSALVKKIAEAPSPEVAIEEAEQFIVKLKEAVGKN